ncbi:MAG: hypothetical protein Q9224_006053, partial [Gallowayella concinna]
EEGVFYLGFQDSSYADVLRDVHELFAFAKDLFDLSAEEKLRYDIDKLDGESKLNGYKPVGRTIGGNGVPAGSHSNSKLIAPGLSGGFDGFESFAIPGNRPIDASLLQLPLLVSNYTSLTEISIRIRQILHLLLRSLSTSLNLPADADLTNVHRAPVPSSLTLEAV